MSVSDSAGHSQTNSSTESSECNESHDEKEVPQCSDEVLARDHHPHPTKEEEMVSDPRWKHPLRDCELYLPMPLSELNEGGLRCFAGFFAGHGNKYLRKASAAVCSDDLMHGHLVPVYLPWPQIKADSMRHKRLNKANFPHFLRHYPSLVLGLMSAAIHQVLLPLATKAYQSRSSSNSPNIGGMKWKMRVVVRITEMWQDQKSLSVSDLSARFDGVFVRMDGRLVSQESHITRKLTSMVCECCSCGSRSIHELEPPHYFMSDSVIRNDRCGQGSCKGRNKIASLMDRRTQSMKIESFTLQCDDNERGGNRVGGRIQLEFNRELCGLFSVGDHLSLIGEVIHRSSDSSWWFCVNWAVPFEKAMICPYQKIAEHSDGQTVVNYLKHCKSEGKSIFAGLVHSLCPAVFGHCLVKAGLILSLFGGNQSRDWRPNIHALLCGDPGTGKSVLCQSVLLCSPNGVAAHGGLSTAAGLTVAMTGKKGACEAGAAVRADGGHLVCDEMDKFSKAELTSLLEVTAQRKVSLAKAGTVQTIRVDTTIVGACNPRFSTYDRSKTVAENMSRRMSPALLSRFDLLFLMLEDYEDLGRMQGEFGAVIAASDHLNSTPKNLKKRRRMNDDISNDIQTPDASPSRSSVAISSLPSSSDPPSLNDLLREDGELGRGWKNPWLPRERLSPSQLRWFVGKARQNCLPKTSDEARRIFTEFFIELRRGSQTKDSTPICPRQLQSMIRMGQARAKCELRERVSEEDAREVVSLMKASLAAVMSSPEVKAGGITNHCSPSQSVRDIERMIVAYARDHREKESFTNRELFEHVRAKVAISEFDFDRRIESLNQKGFLLMDRKSGGRNWRLTGEY